ncbi:hypothetical protein ACFYOY_41540 [Streptomyces sp. NPDC007875]|uniref:hypothetical protein n=1 Tax=Streptomyces sp. NPDC007875 TaxID=3364783 RepID=UPI00367FC571
MANLVYKRVSTDQQSTDRQNLVLAEAGIDVHGVARPRVRQQFAELRAFQRVEAAGGAGLLL